MEGNATNCAWSSDALQQLVLNGVVPGLSSQNNISIDMGNLIIAPLLLGTLWSLCDGAMVPQTSPPTGCLYQGKMYPAGSEISPGPCQSCRCPESGGEVVCLTLDCMAPPCVNPVRVPNQCCARCPDSPNCYMGNKIIPAGKDVMDGDMTCRCPDNPVYFGLGLLIHQAHCTTLITPVY